MINQNTKTVRLVYKYGFIKTYTVLADIRVDTKIKDHIKYINFCYSIVH